MFVYHLVVLCEVLREVKSHSLVHCVTSCVVWRCQTSTSFIYVTNCL